MSGIPAAATPGMLWSKGFAGMAGAGVAGIGGMVLPNCAPPLPVAKARSISAICSVETVPCMAAAAKSRIRVWSSARA